MELTDFVPHSLSAGAVIAILLYRTRSVIDDVKEVKKDLKSIDRRLARLEGRISGLEVIGFDNDARLQNGD